MVCVGMEPSSCREPRKWRPWPARSAQCAGCGRHAVQFKMLPQTTRRRQLQARVRQRIPIGARPEIHNSSRSRPRTAHAEGGVVALDRDALRHVAARREREEQASAGIPATGKRFSSVRGSTILELEGGEIRRESDYWDAATFMRQVGLLPSQ